MTDQVVEQVQTEAEELASAMAGYNARGATPPAEEPEQSVTPEETPEVAPAADDVPAEPSVTDKLESLKAEIKAMKETSDPDVVRRMYGEIGNLNRTIKQMQTAPKSEAPATDEVAAALESAEQVAKDFPEIGEPMVRALKAVASRAPTAAPVPEVDIDARLAQQFQAARLRDAEEALAEEHPDFKSVIVTPEFQSWVSKKPADEQKRIATSQNPFVASKYLSEYKESLIAKQKKHDRLAAAVTPQGVPQSGGQSTIPDEQGFSNGYNRKRYR